MQTSARALALTLADAYREFYFVDELSPRTRERNETHLRTWASTTGDPPIGRVTNETLEAFRAGCLAAGFAPATINRAWGTLRAIFRRLGPAFHKNPAGLGLIERVPYMRPVREVRRPPRRVALEDLSRLYLAAGSMTYPKRTGVPPAAWWRALIVAAYCLGLRREDLLSLEVDQFDLRELTVEFVAGKTRKGDIFPVHVVLSDHLQSVWPADGGRIFRGLQARGSRFTELWRRLLKGAELAKPFTLHDIRRTAASEVDRIERGLGAVFLQHAARSVSERSYLNACDELREAVDKMRIPPAFVAPAAEREKMERAGQRANGARLLLPGAPDPGAWRFGSGWFSFEGVPFELGGRPLVVLRELALAGGPVGVEAMAAVMERGARNRKRWAAARRRAIVEVSTLRVRLRELFGLSGDWNPVVCLGRSESPAWSLYLPAHVERGLLAGLGVVSVEQMREARLAAGLSRPRLSELLGERAEFVEGLESRGGVLSAGLSRRLRKILGDWLPR